MKEVSYSLEILTTSIGSVEHVLDEFSRSHQLSETFGDLLKTPCKKFSNLNAVLADPYFRPKPTRFDSAFQGLSNGTRIGSELTEIKKLSTKNQFFAIFFTLIEELYPDNFSADAPYNLKLGNYIVLCKLY